MLHRRDAAEQQVGEAEARGTAVDDPGAGRARRGLYVSTPVPDVAADAELMAAAHEREVVDHVVGGIQVRRFCRAGRKIEGARHVDRHLTSKVRIHLDAEVGRIEVRRVVPPQRRVVVRHPDRVHDSRPEDHGVAEGQHVRHVVEAGDRTRQRDGFEHVVALALIGRRLLDEHVHVAAEHRMVGAPLEVDPPDGLALVAVVASLVGDLAAGVGRRRQALGEIERRRAELRWIDAVTDEWRAQYHLCAAVARRRGKHREVAGEHGGRGHPGNLVGRPEAQHRALIAAEEKEPVARHRPADRSSELMAPQPVVLACPVGADGGKRARGVEPPVAQELEGVAVECIRARFRDRVH